MVQCLVIRHIDVLKEYFEFKLICTQDNNILYGDANGLKEI